MDGVSQAPLWDRSIAWLHWGGHFSLSGNDRPTFILDRISLVPIPTSTWRRKETISSASGTVP